MANPIMQFFTFGHLPEPLKAVSKDFWNLACVMDASLPEGAEKEMGFRKLLEAKDCFVRARLQK